MFKVPVLGSYDETLEQVVPVLVLLFPMLLGNNAVLRSVMGTTAAVDPMWMVGATGW